MAREVLAKSGIVVFLDDNNKIIGTSNVGSERYEHEMDDISTFNWEDEVYEEENFLDDNFEELEMPDKSRGIEIRNWKW